MTQEKYDALKKISDFSYGVSLGIINISWAMLADLETAGYVEYARGFRVHVTAAGLNAINAGPPKSELSREIVDTKDRVLRAAFYAGVNHVYRVAAGDYSQDSTEAFDHWLDSLD